jgi:hypothetical protein
MTLVRGSLVALLCMPVFVVGCGAEPGTVGQDVVADDSGDMLDGTADVGPSERELELATSIVRRYMQLRDIRDPITAAQMFEFGDIYELVGAGRERAPDFNLGAIGRSLLPDCITVYNDTITFASCDLGPVSLNAQFKLNFTTIDLSMEIVGMVGSYEAGAELWGAMSVSEGALDASLGTGSHFGSLDASIGIEMVDLAIADCGPTIGSLSLELVLLDQPFNVNIPISGCE